MANASRRRLRSNGADRAYQRDYLADNPAKRLLYSAKRRAAERGVPFDLAEADIVVPKFCPALGLRLKTAPGPRRPNSPSLDRFRPSLGYVRGNVIVISDLANRIKQEATAEQVSAVAQWMLSHGDT